VLVSRNFCRNFFQYSSSFSFPAQGLRWNGSAIMNRVAALSTACLFQQYLAFIKVKKPKGVRAYDG
jgi:hypothetical protein